MEKDNGQPFSREEEAKIKKIRQIRIAKFRIKWMETLLKKSYLELQALEQKNCNRSRGVSSSQRH